MNIVQHCLGHSLGQQFNKIPKTVQSIKFTFIWIFNVQKKNICNFQLIRMICARIKPFWDKTNPKQKRKTDRKFCCFLFFISYSINRNSNSSVFASYADNKIWTLLWVKLLQFTHTWKSTTCVSIAILVKSASFSRIVDDHQSKDMAQSQNTLFFSKWIHNKIKALFEIYVNSSTKFVKHFISKNQIYGFKK